ncbi:MAG: sensor histidine kinase [Chloroflexota bacterium]|nr:sensor histidine kinase [Chloroflexota bacterium]
MASTRSGFEHTYGQATEGVRRGARRTYGLTALFREQYRRKLEEWMQLRASLDQHAGGATSPRLSALQNQHEQLGREVAGLQNRLKRLDVAARQLDIVAAYLASSDPQPHEPILTDADASPAAMTLRVIQAQEGERQRLAEEVHDGPAQVLTNAIFQVEYLDRVLADSPDAARDELTFLRSMLRDGLDEVRGFITNLRPPAVDVGLNQAIAVQAGEFQARHGIEVQVAVQGIDDRLDPGGKQSVLRILQESLQNVRKHAAATQVSIGLKGNLFIISDNGRGFDVMRLASGASRNFGLQFMRERAELMGAQLQIESRQGEGTRILLRLPH